MKLFVPQINTFVTLPIPVGTAVIAKTSSAFFDMPLRSDAMATGAASGEIQKHKAFFTAMIAGLGHGNERRLNRVEGFLGDHRHMHALMQFALVHEDAIVKFTTEQIAKR